MRFPVMITPLLTGAAFFMVFAAGNESRSAVPSLNEVIAGLDTTSPVLAEARLRLTAARSAYTSSRALPNPGFFIEQQNLRDDTENASERTLGIQQPLNGIWSWTTRMSAQRLFWDAEKASYEESRRELIVRVVSAAAEYHSQKQQSDLLDSVLVTAEHAQHAMNARRREGDVSDYDAGRLQAELVQLRFRRIELAARLNQAASEFTALTGMSGEILAALLPPELSPPPFADADAAVQHALQNRLQLRSKSELAKAHKAAFMAAKLDQLPDLSVGIARKTVDPDFTGLVWQAEIEIPLWGHRSSQRKIAQAEYEQSEIDYRAELARTEQEVRAAMFGWQLLLSSGAASPMFNQTDAELGLRRGVQLYLSGEFSSLELADALRSGLDGWQAQLDLQTAYLTTNLELRRVTGLAILE